MNYVFARSLGSNSTALRRAETTSLISTLNCSGEIFHGFHEISDNHDSPPNITEGRGFSCAHKSGVNSIAIDKFEGRFLLSAGADSSVALWDLEDNYSYCKGIYHSIAKIPRTSSTHRLGITHISYYPFDSQAFLTSSYDHTVKLFDVETLSISTTFNLGSVVYFHALSSIASHLLIASATQDPAVRLTDLRSGANVQSLMGHNAALISIAWSPKEDHILVSGSVDGTVRIWDIRKSSNCLGQLDMDDHIGSYADEEYEIFGRTQKHSAAHVGAVNGICWTEDARYLVTAGHDQRVRVWDVDKGANTLTNFGPLLKNSHLSAQIPVVVPADLVSPTKDIVFIPSEDEILMYELFDGRLIKRLKCPTVTPKVTILGQQNPGLRHKNRVTALAWRAHQVELYSAQIDGTIRAWKPPTASMMSEGNDTVTNNADEESRKRKRQVLEDVYADLTRRKVTFGLI